MTKIALSAFRYNVNLDSFMNGMDLINDGTHIGEDVVITFSTAKTVDNEYLDGLISHLAKMKVDGYIYTDIKVLSLDEVKMKDS